MMFVSPKNKIICCCLLLVFVTVTKSNPTMCNDNKDAYETEIYAWHNFVMRSFSIIPKTVTLKIFRLGLY